MKIAIIRLIKVPLHILSLWVEMTQYFTNSQSWIIRFFNPLSASVALIQKPVNWFAQHIYIRVTVALNGLNESRKFMRLRYESTCFFIESSRQEVFCEKDVLRNFTKFTGKHLCQCLFFNKVAIRRPATFLKRDSGTGVFLWIWWNLQEHLFLQNTSGGCFCFIFHRTLFLFPIKLALISWY